MILRLERREPAQNRQRFYAIIVRETLMLDFYEFFAGGGLAWLGLAWFGLELALPFRQADIDTKRYVTYSLQ